MSKQDIGIRELVRCSTVRLETATSNHLGTGFFAAPGFVLTAAHVVARAKDDPAAVAVVWGDARYVPTDVRLLADPPAVTRTRSGDVPYPWPDIAVLKLDFTEHPCALLSDGWPSEDSPPSLYSWGFADEYQRHTVGGISTRLAYNGPIDDTASPLDAGGRRPQLLKVKWERIIPGMSGSPVLDESEWRVCAVMKRTRNDLAQEGGYATAVADIWAFAARYELVAELRDGQRAYGQHLLHDDTLETKARWGCLPERVAGKLEAPVGLARALRAALADRGFEIDLTLVPENRHVAHVARRLFASDIETLALALTTLVKSHTMTADVARDIFQDVACCLPVSADWETVPADRPVPWWIPPEAADQLLREVQAEPPRVAAVPTNERETIEMLVRRASARRQLFLAKTECDDVRPPLANSWLDAVDAVIRTEVPGAGEGWWKRPKSRARVVEYLRKAHILIPLPATGPLRRSDIEDLYGRFGDVPFLLARRDAVGALEGSPHLVTIQPDVDVEIEEEAVFHYRNVLGQAS